MIMFKTSSSLKWKKPSKWVNAWILASIWGIAYICILVTFVFSAFRENDHCFQFCIMSKEHILPTQVCFTSFQILLKSIPPLGFSWVPNLQWSFSSPVFSSTSWLYLTFDIHHVIQLWVTIFFVLVSYAFFPVHNT